MRNESNTLSDELLQKLLRILVLYQLVALIIVGSWTALTWGQGDWTVMWVPEGVLQWSLIGAVAGALYRLSSYPKLSKIERAQLYLWMLAKPFIGTALGGVIYFVAVSSTLVLNGNNEIKYVELLNALAFFGAFSDKFAFSVLNRLSLRT